MMKQKSRLAAFLLTLCLLASLAVMPAAAAGESPVPALVPVVAAPQAEGDWCLAG